MQSDRFIILVGLFYGFTHETLALRNAGVFCVQFETFSRSKCEKMQKNAKKCKKMQKNAKKIQKNLHISKICCNFAPSFKNKDKRNPIRNPKITKL